MARDGEIILFIRVEEGRSKSKPPYGISNQQKRETYNTRAFEFIRSQRSYPKRQNTFQVDS